MIDHANYVRRFYELYVEGDADGALRMLTDDVEWRAPNCLPYGGMYKGHSGVATYASAAAEYYDSITVEVGEAVEASDDRAIVVGTFGGRTRESQTDFEVPFCQLWEFRDGKGALLEYWNDSGAVLRALGIEPAPLT